MPRKKRATGTRAANRRSRLWTSNIWIAEREPADVDEHRSAVGGDGIGDQGEDSERSRFHHDPDDLQQDGRGRLEQGRERASRFAGHPGADSEQDGDEDDRQHVSLGESLEDIDGNDPDKLLIGRRRSAYSVRRGRAEGRALAGPDQGRHRHSDRHRDRGGEGEQADCLAADPADPLRVAEHRDTRGDRYQDDRHDQHPDRPDEQVADELDVRRGLGPQGGEQQAERQRRQHAFPERDREPGAKQAHGQLPSLGARASPRPAAAPVSAPSSTAATPLTNTASTPAARRVGSS